MNIYPRVPVYVWIPAAAMHLIYSISLGPVQAVNSYFFPPVTQDIYAMLHAHQIH